MLSSVFISITLLSFALFYIGTGKDKRFLTLTTLWVVLVGIVSLSGYFTNTLAKPPRFILILLGAIILSVIFYVIVKKNQLNLSLLLAIHTLRLPIELVLYQLYIERKVPVLMTFKGWNFDIFMGISAIILMLYLLLSKNILSKYFILAWNILGLGFLLFIIAIAILSSPLPLQKFAFDQPNIAVLHFPYVYLPAFVVPLVVLSHILTLRNYRRSTTGNKELRHQSSIKRCKN
ncbi:hypothetical protein [Arenibacter sp. F26102]|uniref:hypothetical protein n=1 Tax=Arenibacter sp. F26102 TaxID=2926416 RepID=UPI001FF5A9D2|nr:hypothetical protein [Arenibacter sp. F26102]